jgi:hypothetical protein
MKDISKILRLVIGLVILVLIYLIFNTSNHTKEAIKSINKVNEELKAVQDSLQKAQNTIQITLQKVEKTENELKFLKAERELIVLEEKKKTAKNWKELQFFKDEMIRLEKIKEQLKQEANSYEL